MTGRVASPSAAALLRIQGLTIGFAAPGGAEKLAVHNVGFELVQGEILGIVGESGSGKTLVARSILGLLPTGARICAGAIELEGKDLRALPKRDLRKVRGARIGMVFQEPLVALNPSLPIGVQLLEALRLHTSLPRKDLEERGVGMLARVRMPSPRLCLSRYPHEFSGGMRQRVMLASAMLLRPSLLLADEPTTALDSIAQREVLEIMVEVTSEAGSSVVLISHDLALVAQYARRVLVMRDGEVVESGATRDVLLAPQHPYTRALLESLPGRGVPRPSRRAGAPLVSARAMEVTFIERRPWSFGRRRAARAVDHVDLDIRRGESLAIVGESGSGKTTLGRALLRLQEPRGEVLQFDGTDLLRLERRRLRALRPRMQLVFQDPYSSLDPRLRVGELVAEGLRLWSGHREGDEQKVRAALSEVGLDAGYERRYPHELSGGQRQRVCIARALVLRPDLIVADEPVASLDVTTQAEVLRQLRLLQERHGFALLLISHNLGVVEQVADRVAVMLRGRIVELGTRDAIFERPHHPYTRRLLAAAPVLSRVGSSGSYEVAWRKPPELLPPPGHEWDVPTDNGWTTNGASREFIRVSEDHFVACRPLPRHPVEAPAKPGPPVPLPISR